MNLKQRGDVCLQVLDRSWRKFMPLADEQIPPINLGKKDSSVCAMSLTNQGFTPPFFFVASDRVLVCEEHIS